MAAPRVGVLVPEPVLVRRTEGVDHHDRPVRVDAELLLPVDVEKAAGTDLLLHRVVDPEDRLPDPVELPPVERGELQRLLPGEQAVHGLELGRDLEVRLRERDPVLERAAGGEAERLGPDGTGLDAVPHRAGEVVAHDHLERDEVVLRVRPEGPRLRHDADALHAHGRGAALLEEVVGDAEPGADRKPVRRRPVERLALVRDLARYVLVEDRDVVRESELELGRRDLVDLLDLAATQVFRRTRGRGGRGRAHRGPRRAERLNVEGRPGPTASARGAR